MDYDGRYENGNPPYSLYQGDDDKWGLVDKDGTRLPAVFKRLDEERFQEAPWSVVTFNHDKGFELLAWCDPCEAWFNFTWDDPRYPEEFSCYLWKKPEKKFLEYKDEIGRLMPSESHWLLDCINEADRIFDIEDEEEYHIAAGQFLANYPQLADAADFNRLLAPVMRNAHVPEDMKIALWQAKVLLDDHVKLFQDEISSLGDC